MKTSLTISLEQELLQQADAYAQQTGHELAELLTAYIEQLAHHLRPLPELPPQIQALRGIIRLPDDADYKAIVAEELAQKYGS